MANILQNRVVNSVIDTIKRAWKIQCDMLHMNYGWLRIQLAVIFTLVCRFELTRVHENALRAHTLLPHRMDLDKSCEEIQRMLHHMECSLGCQLHNTRTNIARLRRLAMCLGEAVQWTLTCCKSSVMNKQAEWSKLIGIRTHRETINRFSLLFCLLFVIYSIRHKYWWHTRFHEFRCVSYV